MNFLEAMAFASSVLKDKPGETMNSNWANAKPILVESSLFYDRRIDAFDVSWTLFSLRIACVDEHTLPIQVRL
jgi:hypothetical protein